MRRLDLPVFAVGFGLAVMWGCPITRPDPLHCTNNDGDAYCAEQFPDGSRPYCEAGVGTCISSDNELGCVAERPADACYSPCGGRSTIAENGECVMDESSSGSSSGGMETEESSGSSESSTTGPGPCMGNEDCPDAAAPLCEPSSGECVRCDAFGAEGDAACAELDPASPVCLDGACVQCTAAAPEACTGMTPICDDDTNTCVPCNAHDQCGEAACNLFTGACLPADAVVHVGGAMPDFATIADAVASFDMMTEGTIIVHQADYNEAVTVDGGRVLALLANAGDTPTLALIAGGAPQLTVGDGTVLLDGLRLSGNADAVGLVVDGGRAWVDRSRIVDNNGGGVLAQGGAELVLRNSFVGGSVDDATALEVDGATANVLYSTLGAGTTNGVGLACTTPVSVVVRNSLIVSRGVDVTGGFDVVCNEAEITFSATERVFPGVGNEAVGEMDGTMPQLWFVGYGTGDFHLQNQGLTVFADIAQWTQGDPTTDIDGDLRPTVDGTADFAGADTVP